MYYAEKLKCFVVGTVNPPTKYIHVSGGRRYALAGRLSGATKIASRETAARLIESYHSSTGDFRDFAIVPLEVTYELIDERRMN